LNAERQLNGFREFGFRIDGWTTVGVERTERNNNFRIDGSKRAGSSSLPIKDEIGIISTTVETCITVRTRRQNDVGSRESSLGVKRPRAG